MQTELSFYEENTVLEESLEDNRELGKQVRNHSYKQVMQKESTGVQCSIIQKILQGHPEGITDLEICILTGFPRSSVTARRNEIPNMIAVGIAKEADRLNTLWSIESSSSSRNNR